MAEPTTPSGPDDTGAMPVPTVLEGLPPLPGPSPECESCGRTAAVQLTDGSLWCWPCHTSALDMGYDRDLGTVLDDGAPA